MSTLRVHVILFNRNRVLMVPKLNKFQNWEWEFPNEDVICSDPSLQAAAIRIVKKETGLDINTEFETLDTIGTNPTSRIQKIVAVALDDITMQSVANTAPISPRWIETGFIGRYQLTDKIVMILGRNPTPDWIASQISY